jgi:hypothetical protein
MDIDTRPNKGSTVVLYDMESAVRLVIGKEKRAVVASKAVLTILSPVFRAMFTRGFQEAAEGCSEVSLPEDNFEALLFLLRLAHLKFEDLPETLTFPDLYELAVVCDKYDAAGPVKLFLDKYSGPYKIFVSNPWYEEWLFIAWAFGLRETYQSSIKAIIWNSAVEDGVLCRSGRPIEHLLPPHALGKLCPA